MTRLTNLVQFPGLGLSFELNRVAFSIGRFNVYWHLLNMRASGR